MLSVLELVCVAAIAVVKQWAESKFTMGIMSGIFSKRQYFSHVRARAKERAASMRRTRVGNRRIGTEDLFAGMIYGVSFFGTDVQGDWV